MAGAYCLLPGGNPYSGSTPMKAAQTLYLLLVVTGAVVAAAPTKQAPKSPDLTYAPQPWGTWVEPDFPFFSSVLDARREGICRNNLTPRAIILPLDHGCWVAIDTDLCRLAAIWRGKGVSDQALAPGSYHDPSRKTPGGQFPAPQPEGKLWLGNALIPGWQMGPLQKTDPRPAAPSPEEVGRGPLAAGQAQGSGSRSSGRLRLRTAARSSRSRQTVAVRG